MLVGPPLCHCILMQLEKVKLSPPTHLYTTSLCAWHTSCRLQSGAYDTFTAMSRAPAHLMHHVYCNANCLRCHFCK